MLLVLIAYSTLLTVNITFVVLHFSIGNDFLTAMFLIYTFEFKIREQVSYHFMASNDVISIFTNWTLFLIIMMPMLNTN